MKGFRLVRGERPVFCFASADPVQTEMKINAKICAQGHHGVVPWSLSIDRKKLVKAHISKTIEAKCVPEWSFLSFRESSVFKDKVKRSWLKFGQEWEGFDNLGVKRRTQFDRNNFLCENFSHEAFFL